MASTLYIWVGSPRTTEKYVQLRFEDFHGTPMARRNTQKCHQRMVLMRCNYCFQCPSKKCVNKQEYIHDVIIMCCTVLVLYEYPCVHIYIYSIAPHINKLYVHSLAILIARITFVLYCLFGQNIDIETRFQQHML